jgi:hypothetical protein
MWTQILRLDFSFSFFIKKKIESHLPIVSLCPNYDQINNFLIFLFFLG